MFDDFMVILQGIGHGICQMGIIGIWMSHTNLFRGNPKLDLSILEGKRSNGRGSQRKKVEKWVPGSDPSLLE